MNAAVQPMPAPYSPTPSQIAMAYSVCRSITRSAAKNFYYAFLVLPPAKRQALCAVYAFMRRCDDISDDGKLLAFARRQMLEAWVDSFHRAQAGHPTDDAVLLALTDTQRRFNIPVELLDQLAFGTGMDIQQNDAPDATRTEGLQVLYRTFGDLRVYCYRVASVVGLVCIRIFGYRDPAAEPLAESLGLAFQLTNIIRDIKEDAALGRVYLPAEDLARFKIEPGELSAARIPERLRWLLAAEADRAREYYYAAGHLIPLIEEDSQPALWVLVTIYRRLLEKITRRQYDVFGKKVNLSVREKVVILGKGLLKRLA
ncbi:MAG TPA: phytoene/squalene synthase family protein [Terriglobales bacterium]|jgi:phytoene synthase|nr:phytoene/squalene synthase family protein [Terriglobales bacterium]